MPTETKFPIKAVTNASALILLAHPAVSTGGSENLTPDTIDIEKLNKEWYISGAQDTETLESLAVQRQQLAGDQGDEWRPEVEDLIYLELERLASDWERDTAFSSSITQKAIHPAYQRIISLGNRAIPFILNRLEDEPGHWFWALKVISGKDPVPAQSQGDLAAMTAAWLEWGRRNGYC